MRHAWRLVANDTLEREIGPGHVERWHDDGSAEWRKAAGLEVFGQARSEETRDVPRPEHEDGRWS